MVKNNKNKANTSNDEFDEVKKYELETLLEELEGYKGRHTELITVFIPAGAAIYQTKKQLEDEKGTATNIKSTATRKNVMNALDLAVRKLKELGRTPPNGLAVFSGNVTKEDGRESLEIWTVEPPKKLMTKIYRCDQTFVLWPLQEMLETDEIYGLLIIEANESSIGVLDGRHVRLLETLHSGVPGKHKTGGQSAQRFERVRDSELKTFFKRTAEHLKKFFWDEKKLKGIFIGGNFPTNEDFLRQSQLVTQLKNKVMCVKNMGGTKLNGLHELVGLCQQDLEEAEITKQKLIIDSFMVKLKTEPNMVSYGEAEVTDRLKRGAVDKLILSKSLSRDKVKMLKKLADVASTAVYMISGDTPEGVQFDNLGMIGGMLRFEIYD